MRRGGALHLPGNLFCWHDAASCASTDAHACKLISAAWLRLMLAADIL